MSSFLIYEIKLDTVVLLTKRISICNFAILNEISKCIKTNTFSLNKHPSLIGTSLTSSFVNKMAIDMCNISLNEINFLF